MILVPARIFELDLSSTWRFYRTPNEYSSTAAFDNLILWYFHHRGTSLASCAGRRVYTFLEDGRVLSAPRTRVQSGNCGIEAARVGGALV